MACRMLDFAFFLAGLYVCVQELPVAEYLTVQGRFAHLTPEQINPIQAETDHAWQDLKEKVSKFTSIES